MQKEGEQLEGDSYIVEVRTDGSLVQGDGSEDKENAYQNQQDILCANKSASM